MYSEFECLLLNAPTEINFSCRFEVKLVSKNGKLQPFLMLITPATKLYKYFRTVLKGTVSRDCQNCYTQNLGPHEQAKMV